MEGGQTIPSWGIILNDGTELDIQPSQESTIPGFIGGYANGVTSNTFIITVNTTETSVTGLVCFSIVNRSLVPSTINVVIYGKYVH